MKYKLISETFYDEKEYTVYKVLCKKRWYLPWEASYKTIKWDLGIDNSDLEFTAEANPVDACYEMILKLKENNIL